MRRQALHKARNWQIGKTIHSIYVCYRTPGPSAMSQGSGPWWFGNVFVKELALSDVNCIRFRLIICEIIDLDGHSQQQL